MYLADLDSPSTVRAWGKLKCDCPDFKVTRMTLNKALANGG